MIIVLGCVAIVASIFIVAHLRHSEDAKSFALFMATVVGLGLTLVIVFNPLTVRGKIQEFKSVRQTVEEARGNPDISAIELAAIQTEVIKANSWLANNKYYRNNLFTSWFIPKSVLKLEPIK